MSRTLRAAPVLALVLLALTGCKQSTSNEHATAPAAKTPVKAAPPTPLSEKKEELGTDHDWTPAFDAYIEKNLPQEILSAQAGKAVKSYCPAFNTMSDVDRRAFWAYTLQAMAAAEAGLDADTTVHHTQAAVAKTDKVTHRPIRQEGLLQLSYQDGDTYGCNFDWQADSKLNLKDPNRTILQPERNLSCGIRILRTQLIDKDQPLLTRSSYWSTLQPGTRSNRNFAKQMANVPASCARPETGHSTTAKTTHRASHR